MHFAIVVVIVALLSLMAGSIWIVPDTPPGEGPQSIPEPGTALLLGAGLVGLFIASRRRRG